MISILIPVYNYDIVALVYNMKVALEKVPEYSEIIIGDDGSSEDFRQKYQSLEGGGVRIISSEKNIGRAAIRNRLAMEAKGDYLLFIDADTNVPGTTESYLLNWLPYLNIARVICGGTVYMGGKPSDPDKMLRWNYGRKIEQRKASERNKNPHSSFSTFNVMIEKSIFSKIRFNEELTQYGHEDTLLGYQLKKANIDILHIDNGLIHEGLESNSEFLEKTRLGVENLSKLVDMVTDKRAFAASVKLIRVYNRFAGFGLTGLLSRLYVKYHEKMEIELDSSKASLLLFGFYKISMFSTFREIHQHKPILQIF